MRTALLWFILCCWIFSASAQSDAGESEGIQNLEQELAQPFSDSARVSMMVEMATKFQNTGSMDEALSLFKEAYLLADSLHNPYLLQKAADAYAMNLLDRDRPDSAITILQHPLELFPDSKYSYHLLNMLGTAYRFKAEYNTSLKTYREAKALVDSVENPRMYANINFNMATVYASLGNKAAALDQYLKGIEFAETAKDSVFLATALNNLGETYNQFSQPKDAEYYLERSRQISEDIGYRMGVFRAVFNLANTKRNINEFEAALTLYDEALELHEELRPGTPPFRIIHSLGALHFMAGDFEQAEENFRLSLTHSNTLDVPQGLYHNNEGLAKVAEQRGEPEEAIEYYKKALDVANKLGAASLQQSSLKNISRLSKEIGDYRQALAYHEQYKTNSDSLRRLENKQHLSETEALLDLRKQEQVNNLLQENQQAQEARIVTQNWLIIAGIVIIILILISVVMLNRSKEEKQRINEELESQRDQLQQMNKVKDKIMAIMAHDLRSPLSSMQGMLYLLREDDLSKEEMKMMTVQMELSLSQNINMMDNLLAWAREQMSGMAVDMETIAGREIVEEVFSYYDFKARQKGVKLVNKVSEGLKVRADNNLLKLILRNLIANSIKFTSDGDAITISTREDGGKVAFEVNDTGIGIPEEDQQNLFTMYGKSRQGTDNEKGSGLGLQLCKEFVEKQDGEIAVQSTEGQGTTFSFTLPRAS